MTKCEQYKDLILTDYIDGRLDKDTAQGLESHLLQCSDCRVFAQEVKKNAALPFQQASRQPVPAGLWFTIRQNIGEQPVSPWAQVTDMLKGLLAYPRVVPVFASLVLMLLVGSVTVNTIQIQQAKDKDQGEYLVSLLSSTSSSGTTDNNDLGTPIEHYFL